MRSNTVLSLQEGFIARKLLKCTGNHASQQMAIIVITKSKEAFAMMHTSPEHSKLHSEALTFMTRPPKIAAYDSVS